MKHVLFTALLLFLVSCGNSRQEVTRAATLPTMAWDHRENATRWTRAGIAAVMEHGTVLIGTVPADIHRFCPRYAENGPNARAAFWVGMLSALAKHESTWNAGAVGGGNQWFGLTQISPATARGYGCRAQSGEALKNGADNLSCAIRIAAHQVPRDGYLVTDGNGWRGMARDWAPFRRPEKVAEMAAFTSRQSYCR